MIEDKISNEEYRYSINTKLLALDSVIGSLGYSKPHWNFLVFFLVIPMIIELILYFYFAFVAYNGVFPEIFSFPVLILVLGVQPFFSIKYYEHIMKCYFVANYREFRVDFVNNPKKSFCISKNAINQFFIKKGEKIIHFIFL